MPSPYGTSDHLALIWRDLSDVETAAANALFPVAAAIVAGRVPDLAERLADGRLDEDVVAYVVETMVQRVLVGRTAPEGVKSESKTLGPFTGTTTFVDPQAAATDLVLDDDLLAVLVPPSPRSNRRTVGTIPVRPARWC